MPKLDELPADVYVAWFGLPWDEYCTNDIKIPCPEDMLCHKCVFQIGSRSTGAAVKTADGDWIYYHRDCYWEHLEEVANLHMAADALEADTEDLDDFP